MESTHLRVVVSPRPPFIFAFNSSTTGHPNYTGLLIDLFNKILAFHNSSFTYEMYPSPINAGGAALDDGVTWTGVTGELVNGNADVGLFPLTRTAARLSVIDCTYSYMDQGLTLLVQSKIQSPGPLSVLAPFSVTLWVTLLCTIIAVSLLFWALDLYGKWIRSKQTKVLRSANLDLEKPSIRGGKRVEKNSPIMTSFSAAAGAPERPGRISWGGQVLYIFYCFFCLIVLSAYTANLTSFLAVVRADNGISSLQDVLMQNGQIVVNANGSTAAYFASSQDSVAMQMVPNMRYCGPVDECVGMVRSGQVDAFVSDNGVIEYQAMQKPCDLAVVGDPFGPGNLVIGLQKNSSLLTLFNEALQEFNEDGTLTELQRTWFEDRSQCGDINGQLSNSRLTVQQMLGAFVFLCLGVLAAFTTGTIENLKWCLLRNAAESRRATETSNREPSQRGQSAAVHRGSRLSRLSMALTGFSKRSGYSGEDGRVAAAVAAVGPAPAGGAVSGSCAVCGTCAVCGAARRGIAGGMVPACSASGAAYGASAGSGAGLGWGSGSQGFAGGHHGSGGAAGPMAAGQSPFLSGAVGRGIGVTAPVDANGFEHGAVAAGPGPEVGDGASTSALAATATTTAAVAAHVGAGLPMQGPTRPVPVSPLYGTAYDMRPQSQAVLDNKIGAVPGSQGVCGGQVELWGSGVQERAPRSASSISEACPAQGGTSPPSAPPPEHPRPPTAAAACATNGAPPPPSVVAPAEPARNNPWDAMYEQGTAPLYGRAPPLTSGSSRHVQLPLGMPHVTAVGSPPAMDSPQLQLLYSPSGLHKSSRQVYGTQSPANAGLPPPTIAPSPAPAGEAPGTDPAAQPSPPGGPIGTQPGGSPGQRMADAAQLHGPSHTSPHQHGAGAEAAGPLGSAPAEAQQQHPQQQHLQQQQQQSTVQALSAGASSTPLERRVVDGGKVVPEREDTPAEGVGGVRFRSKWSGPADKSPGPQPAAAAAVLQPAPSDPLLLH